LAENPKRGGSPPSDSMLKERIILLKNESLLEKIWLIFLIWLLKKNKIIAKEREQ